MITMIHALMMDLEIGVVHVGSVHDDNDPHPHDSTGNWSGPGR
jgi:hypothetical protein